MMANWRDATVVRADFDEAGWIDSLTVGGVSARSVAVRRAPLRIATFGDSTATVSDVGHDTTFVTAAFPAASTTTIYQYADKFPVQHFYSPAFLVRSGGVTGQTTTQMLARDAAAAGATRYAIADVLDGGPDVVLLHGGSINNLTPIAAGTYAAIVATCYAEHVQIINRLLTGVGVVIDSGLFGYSAVTASYPALVRQALVELNAMFAAYAATLPGRVYFIDPVEAGISSADGNFVSGMSVDGVHLSVLGSFADGQAQAEILAGIFGQPADAPRWIGANLATNPMMTPTSVVAYGTVPTNWVAGGVNAAAADAAVEIIDGEQWLTCTITASASNNYGFIYVPFNASTAGIVANDILGAEYRWRVETESAFTGFSLQGRFQVQKTANGYLSSADNHTSMGATIPAGTYTGHNKFMPLKCPEASASLVAGSGGMYFQFGVAENPAVFRIGITAPRIVNLGQSLSTGAT